MTCVDHWLTFFSISQLKIIVAFNIKETYFFLPIKEVRRRAAQNCFGTSEEPDLFCLCALPSSAGPSHSKMAARAPACVTLPAANRKKWPRRAHCLPMWKRQNSHPTSAYFRLADFKHMLLLVTRWWARGHAN